MAIIAQAITQNQLSQTSAGIRIEALSKSKGGTAANFFSASSSNPSIYTCSHNNSGERVESATLERMAYGVVRKYAVRYHFDSSFNASGGYRIILQNAHYHKDLPSTFFHPSNGGCGAAGSFLMIGTNGTSFTYKLQLPDPATPTKVKCEHFPMFTLAQVADKYIDVLIDQKATNQTDGYYRVYYKIEGQTSWTTLINKSNVRTAWTQVTHAGYFKSGIYSGDPGAGSCTVKMSRIRYADGVEPLSNVTPDGTSPGETTPPPVGVYYKINCGGAASGDYGADQYFSANNTTTSSTTTNINGTTNQAVYRVGRSSNTNLGNFTYTFPNLPNGTVHITLESAEITYNNVGDRVYSVSANGVPKLVNYDPLAVAPKFTALVNEFDAEVTNGTLTLSFSATSGRPNVAAITIEA